jgi:hypothetical protein
MRTCVVPFYCFLFSKKGRKKQSEKYFALRFLPNRSSIAGQISSFYRTAVIAFLFVAFHFAGIVNLPVAGL